MTAVEKFENLLKKVQESNLNYSIQKRPPSSKGSLMFTIPKMYKFQTYRLVTVIIVIQLKG
jgi:hypothetical protein